jgi:hypothetical protein
VDIPQRKGGRGLGRDGGFDFIEGGISKQDATFCKAVNVTMLSQKRPHGITRWRIIKQFCDFLRGPPFVQPRLEIVWKIAVIIR